MQLLHIETLTDYLEYLWVEPDEARRLVDELALTVPEFFGDAELCDRLSEALRSLVASSEPDSPLRICSIGCATGEEACSLAILALELVRNPDQVTVFASDMSHDALARTREGVHPHAIGANLSPERLARHFDAHHTHHRVRRELRDIVIFAAHDLLSDPPYSRLDLVLCRELLRDLEPMGRDRVLRLCHYALREGGLLLAGAGDGAHTSGLFRAIDPAIGLYRRCDDVADALPSIPIGRRSGRPAPGTANPQPSPLSLYLQAIAPHLPASVLVDADDQADYYSEGDGRYLEIPGGELTHDITRRARGALRAPLRDALDHAATSAYATRPVAVETDDGLRQVVLRSQPVYGADGSRLTLVIFDEDTGPAGQPSPDAQARTRLEHYERQLDQTQAALDRGHMALNAANVELAAVQAENRRRIRELRTVARDMEHLLDATGIATLFLDESLRVVRHTPPVETLFVPDGSDARSLAELRHQHDYHELSADALRAMRQGASVDREVTAGGDRWFLVKMRPYRPAKRSDKPGGAVVSLIEITERKRMELKLRDDDRRKDEFLAMLGRELRNPLAGISVSAELLDGDRDPHTVKQAVAILRRQTAQLVRLVDDLLDVSRINSGRLGLAKSPVPPATIIQDAVDSQRPLIEHEGHTLTVTLPDPDCTLHSDAARLTQVCADLLSNAAKYTPSGGHIAIAGRCEAGEAVILVEDDGIGMPQAVRGRVFDMFYQHEDPRVQAKGLGIGLTLVKRLVEMHQGTVAVHSGERGGTTFEVRLPAAQGPAADDPAPVGHGTKALGQSQVLIVDDNADAAEALGTLIRSLGDITVHTAHSGALALETGASVCPDAVILDMQMPEMDGFETARRIRATEWGRDLTLIALSGWGQDEHRRRSLEAGFDDHLVKPADPTRIRALLADSSAENCG